MTQWKKLLGELREMQIRFKVAKPDERGPIEEQYNKLLAQGLEMQGKLLDAALAAYQADPNKDEDLARYLISRAQSELKNDRYPEALKISKLLIDNNFSNPAVYEFAGVAAFVENDYDAAEKYLTAAQEKNSLGPEGQMYLEELPKYRELWQQEQELREANAQADDLPRVLLKTNKGDIVLELFENEAPNSVANFVSLVEKGFYNGLSFHRVIRNFMAQGGDPQGDGAGGPGYTIACEVDNPGARSHFAGTLSMAHAGRDTGGSQFFLTLRQTPHLNGKHTVFGRVIEGMNVLRDLKATEGRAGEPDKIIEAKVLRKREHEYKPTTLAEN